MKVPQLRNLYDKVGFEMSQTVSRSGFGLLHDGSVDSIARFLSKPSFIGLTDDQDIADVVAFLLAFSGSDLPAGDPSDPLMPPGPSSKDTHAAVGCQTTVQDTANPAPGQAQLVLDMLALADTGAVGLVVKGHQADGARGWTYIGGGVFQSDRIEERVDSNALFATAGVGTELTLTLVPRGTERRLGVDRDRDDFFDRDELDAGTDPADPTSQPAALSPPGTVTPP
jgi:hypothetical protein